MMKKFLLALCIIVSVPNFAYSEENYDPQNTMLAINMAVVSIQRIINTQDRITLWQEYNNIINNLAVGNIESDPEMTELYTGILDFISKRTLRQEEEEFFRERYNKIQQRQFSHSGHYALNHSQPVIFNIGGNVFMEESKKLSLMEIIKRIFSKISGRSNSSRESYSYSGIIFQSLTPALVDSITGIAGSGKFAGFVISCVSGIWDYISVRSRAEAELDLGMQNIGHENVYDTVNFLGGLSSLCSSSYFDYQNHKSELLDGLDVKLWQLKKEDIEDCNKLQTRLLLSSWNLLRRYKLSDDFRLDQKNIENFYKAIDEPYAPTRMSNLKNIEARFRMYPPYWFHRGQTARAANDRKEAEYCFDKFNEVWRPVLRQDPYRAEIEKYAVYELAESLAHDFNDNVRHEIMNHLDVLLRNSAQNDWVNYNFAGLGYYASGEKERAERCIANNIDFNFEKEVSKTLLNRIKADSIDISSLSNELEDICLKGIISKAKYKDTAALLACYLRGDYQSVALRLKNTPDIENNIIASEILYLTTRNITSSNEYLAILNNIQRRIDEMRSRSAEPYTDILPLLKFYLERRSNNAYTFTGRMFYYGLGVNRNADMAALFFASSGGYYAEYMAGLCCLEAGLTSEAEKYFLKSVLSDDFSPALFELGQLYSTGQHGKKDYESASKLFLKAAMRGYKPAQARLGDLYYEGGNGIKQSYYNAYVWYQVFEFNNGEESITSNTFDSIISNVKGGGFFMGDETPSERIKLIEGYGLFNYEKLTERERFKARDEAQRIIRRIESQNKFRLVQDSGSYAKTAAAVTTAVGILMFILKNAF